MTVGELVTIVVALLTLVTAVVNHRQIRQVKIDINGKMADLLELTATAARAEGVLLEQQHPAARDRIGTDSP